MNDAHPQTVIADLEEAEKRLTVIHRCEGMIIGELGQKAAALTKLGKMLDDAEVELARCQQFHLGMIRVLDDVERAISAAIGRQDPIPFADGIIMIRDNFLGALRSFGIVRMAIEPGGVFDPKIHEAVNVDPNTARGVIAGIVAPGYYYTSGYFAGRLVRPASVVVGSQEEERVLSEAEPDKPFFTQGNVKLDNVDNDVVLDPPTSTREV